MASNLDIKHADNVARGYPRAVQDDYFRMVVNHFNGEPHRFTIGLAAYIVNRALEHTALDSLCSYEIRVFDNFGVPQLAVATIGDGLRINEGQQHLFTGFNEAGLLQQPNWQDNLNGLTSASPEITRTITEIAISELGVLEEVVFKAKRKVMGTIIEHIH